MKPAPKYTASKKLKELLNLKTTVSLERSQKYKETQKVVRGIWDKHNKEFEKKFSLIEIAIAEETKKGVGKRIRAVQGMHR